jgi:DtxR family transcriptional regulator, Mn-dependent transcriptional regulator
MMMTAKIPGQQTASMEDYLETIALLKEEGKPVTVTAISKAMGVKKSSVNWALTKLSVTGLVLHEKYGDVEFTAEGASIAKDVYQRHEILRRFLVDILNVDPDTANNDACRMEHVLSRDSLSRLEKFIDFVLSCPRGDPEWLKGFNYYVEHGKRDTDSLARCQREEKIER